MEEFDNFVKKNTTWLDDPYISGTLTVFLIVYAGAVAPKLPKKIVQLFDYTFVKFLMFFVIVFLSRKNATVALVAAIAMLVSIMALHRLKFDEEMMEVVSKEEPQTHKIKLNSCNCTCDNFEEMKPKTDDGKLVASEAMHAVNVGVLSQEKAKELVTSIVVAELKNQPVLVPKTDDGAKRMEEIATLVKNGAMNSEEAKKESVVVIVAEAVVKEKETTPIQKINSNSSDNSSLAELAEEVMRRKQEQISKTGFEPTDEEMKNLCANVLDDYRKCKLNCDDGKSCKTKTQDDYSLFQESQNISGVDPAESSYAPARN